MHIWRLFRAGAVVLGFSYTNAVIGQTVDFRNNQTGYPTQADRRVYDGLFRPLVGTNFAAQLYYGRDPSSLQSITNSPARFRNVSITNSLAGTWSGGTRTLWGGSSGEIVILEVRVWDTFFGATFEAAQNAGGMAVRSAPFTYTIPPPMSDPVAFFMDNFRGFGPLSCPSPGRISIAETNGQIQLSFNVYQPVEVSDDMVTWTAIGRHEAPYIDNEAASLSRRFYRLNCGGFLSPNYVGFYRMNFEPGYTFFANQLLLPDDKIRSIFPAPPENTTVFPFDSVAGSYLLLTYVAGAWEGDDLEMRLPPGQGAVLQTDVAFSHTFVGEVILRSTNQLGAGFSIVSSVLPRTSPLNGAGGLNFPAAEGDDIYQFNPVTGGYNLNSFIDGSWEGDNQGNPPVPRVGESFFIFKQAPSSWILVNPFGP